MWKKGQGWDEMRWMLDRSGVSVCWRQLTQTSAAGPKAKPQTGRRNKKETETRVQTPPT